MSKLFNSYLWTPDIMRLSGLLNEKEKLKNEKEPEEINKDCKIEKKSCKKSKITLVKGKGRYVYWNFNPKMIIDLDWVELNSKNPVNVILLEKRKK
jgi:hypothetical protein